MTDLMKLALTSGGAIYALAIIAFPISSVPSVAAEEGNQDPKYLEMRNDLGIVAYCAGKGLLEKDSQEALRAGMHKLFGEKTASAEADLHEQKGREGIFWFQGDGQTIDELAADNHVSVRDICEDYRRQVNIGRIILLQQKEDTAAGNL
ncbi:hypothetical protein [Agrobacterium fabrum]|uniref:hypothetical protein n=1 Tax=Agrobacterium fabrum TaxID=1176649 RepID=UPI003BA325A4